MAELTARMGNMGLNESAHATASTDSPGQRSSAYIPPHLRSRVQAQASNTVAGPPPATNGALGVSRWASAPAPVERFVSIKPYHSTHATSQGLTFLYPAIFNASQMVGPQRLPSHPQTTGKVPGRVPSVHSIRSPLDSIAEQHQEKVFGVTESIFRDHQTLAWNATSLESRTTLLSKPQVLILKNTMTFQLRHLERMSRKLLQHSPLLH